MRATVSSMITVKPSTCVPTFTSKPPELNQVVSFTTGPRMCSTSASSACSTTSPPSSSSAMRTMGAPPSECSSSTSSSTWPASGAWCTSTSRPLSRSTHWTPMTTDSTSVAPTARTPISEPPLGSRFPKKRISQNEVNVIAGMTQACSSMPPSALHHVDLVEVDGGAVAVDEQDDREPDADLGSGHGDGEQGEDLTGDGSLAAPHVAEGHQVDVHRVEDELDRHQDEHAVAPGEHAV